MLLNQFLREYDEAEFVGDPYPWADRFIYPPSEDRHESKWAARAGLHDNKMHHFYFHLDLWWDFLRILHEKFP